LKTRIITGAVLVVVLVVVLLVVPKIGAAYVFGLLCAIAAHELLWATGLVKEKRLAAYTAVAAFLVPVWCGYGMNYLWGLCLGLVFTAVLFGELLHSKAQLPVGQLALCYVGGLVIPYLLSALIRLLSYETGRFLVVVPFVMAFLSDTGAYFTGRFLGKHKLSPIISPKKTVEGVVGGVVAAIAGMLVYCLVVEKAFHLEVNYLYAAVYGFVGSFAGVFGDLCFSAIKRQVGIKDYGHLMPGHGGVLDRFDSVCIVAPLTEILMLLIPVVK